MYVISYKSRKLTNIEPCFDDGKRYVYALARSHYVKTE